MISHRMEVTKVHRAVSFEQKVSLKPYTSRKVRNEQQQIKNIKRFHKLIPNDFYGKIMERLRDILCLTFVDSDNSQEMKKFKTEPSSTS